VSQNLLHLLFPASNRRRWSRSFLRKVGGVWTLAEEEYTGDD
jgi:hypothetical protein